MVERLADSMTKALIQNGTIPQEDRELYAFGFRNGLSTIGAVLSIFLLSVVCKTPLNGIVLLCAIIPLRPYAGGYHAATRLRCYLLSCLVGLLVLLLAKWAPLIPALLCAALGAILIVALAPVQDPHKPLDELERCVYRKRALRCLVIELLLMLFLLSVGQIVFVRVIAYTIFIIGAGLPFGALRNRAEP